MVFIMSLYLYKAQFIPSDRLCIKSSLSDQLISGFAVGLSSCFNKTWGQNSLPMNSAKIMCLVFMLFYFFVCVFLNSLTRSLDSPIFLRGSSTVIDRALQLTGPRKDALVMDNNGFDELVHMCLAGDLIVALRNRHECGAKADSQVVGVHHVVVTVLRQTEKREIKRGKNI